MSTRDSSPSPSRVSLYNPESVLADLSTSPATTPATAQLGSCPVHSHHRINLAQPNGNGASAEENARRQLLWYNRHRRRALPLKLSEHYNRYLEDEGAFLELPKSTTDFLLPIFNTFLDELIPIVDGGAMFRDYSNGHASIFLVRAVCLVACKSKQAAPFLRLHDDGPILGQVEFATKLLSGLDAAVKADLEPDRVTKIQILALMHLNNDSLGGVDRSSNYLSQAICEAWSISLHVKVPVNPDQEQCDLLWWTLRSFDRLNKPIMGASPFIIDDTDIGIDRTVPRQDNYKSQLMALSLRLGDLMTTATKIYKASSIDTVDDDNDFPAFTELTSGISLARFHKSHRAYLQLWYHIAAMLSCRFSGPGSIQYRRRLTSADCVLRIISQEGSDCLPPLPLVPYAMSMSTTVIYRALRDGERLPEVAFKDLEACSDNLDVLSQLWNSAKGVARLLGRLRRFMKPGTFVQQPANAANCTCESSRPDLEEASGSNILSTDSHDQVRDAEGLEPPIPSMSNSSQPHESLGRESVPDHRGLPSQQNETWIWRDLPYSDIDKAFYDFFDYGMPSIFRDPATLDFLQMEDNQDVSPL